MVRLLQGRSICASTINCTTSAGTECSNGQLICAPRWLQHRGEKGDSAARSGGVEQRTQEANACIVHCSRCVNTKSENETAKKEMREI